MHPIIFLVTVSLVLVKRMKMLKHARKVALARIHERSLAFLFSKKVIEFLFEIFILVEWVQLVLLNLHTDQGLVVRIVLAMLDALSSLKETIENASQGLNLIDGLQLGQLFVLVVLLRNRKVSFHHSGDISAADRAASPATSVSKRIRI